MALDDHFMQRLDGIWDAPIEQALCFSAEIAAYARTVGLSAGETLDLSLLVTQSGGNAFEFARSIKALASYLIDSDNGPSFYDMHGNFLGLRHVQAHFRAYTSEQLKTCPAPIYFIACLLAGRFDPKDMVWRG